ncbi:MAG: xanthine dehydrogenase family protein molybdopterin-binding subunit, partial [Betaproteobacteria bacterium]
ILYQENTIKNGRIVESNFHNFKLPQISEMPKVETVLVPSGGFWGGHGEAAILALAPSIINAVFAATGKRIRSLPLKNHDLRKA